MFRRPGPLVDPVWDTPFYFASRILKHDRPSFKSRLLQDVDSLLIWRDRILAGLVYNSKMGTSFSRWGNEALRKLEHEDNKKLIVWPLPIQVSICCDCNFKEVTIYDQTCGAIDEMGLIISPSITLKLPDNTSTTFQQTRASFRNNL
jgi:hypothetical protein